jgi:outer membrane murein-binding lipoprotein Lpp
MPGEFYIEGKKEKVNIAAILSAVADLEAKLDAFVIFRGETTAAGAADGSTLICADLTSKPDFDGHQVVITSGDYAGQARDIDGTTLGGTVSPHLAFGGQIVAGVKFAILAIRTVPAEVAGLAADVAALEAKLDKLAGEMPVAGSSTASWNAAESDVVAIGANDTKYKLHSLLLSMYNLVGTVITVRLYMQVNGVERKVYEQTFDATADPPGLWVVNGTVGIHEVLRVTLQSNSAADDSQAVDYDYMLEAM